MPPWPCPDALGGTLDLVEQGQHIPGIARVALRHKVGKDKTGRWFRHDAGLSTKLRRAITLAFENRRNGRIVGIDKFTVAELFALGEPLGLPTDVLMGAQPRGQRTAETFTRGIAQGRRLFKVLLGLLSKGFEGLAKRKELLFRLAHQLHEDVTLTSTAAAKGAHDFFQRMLEALGLALKRGGSAAALLGDVVDEF